MTDVARRASFADVPLGDGAAALNRVFEHYLVPVAFNAEHLALHISYNDVVPSLSPIWYDCNGNVVAAALLGIRATRGWIGGFGVAPEYRGHGYAKELVERLFSSARGRGLESIALEVLCENSPAIGVYRRAGFETVRRLISLETTVENASSSGFVRVAPDELIDEPDAVAPCWQRERATLRNGAASTAVRSSDGTYALFRYNASIAQILKLRARSSENLTALANAVAEGRQSQRILILNEPEDSPVIRSAQDAHWSRPFLQYEMKVAL